jgi:hypothetical protein
MTCGRAMITTDFYPTLHSHQSVQHDVYWSISLMVSLSTEVYRKLDDQTMLRSSCIDPMKTVSINLKSDLKITNICLSDTIQSAQEESRVSLIPDSGAAHVSILKPFQARISPGWLSALKY